MKELREKGDMSVIEELSQLYMSDISYPVSAKHLTEEQKWDTLEYLMF